MGMLGNSSGGGGGGSFTGGSVSNPILGPDGSASAPTYSFTNAPTIGMYQSGGQLAFSTNGTLAAYITTSLDLILNTGNQKLFGSSSSVQFGNPQDVFLKRYAAKQLSITGDGTGATTNAGWVIGYEGTNSGYSAMWSSTVTPSASNYALRVSSSDTQLNSPSGGQTSMAVNNASKVVHTTTQLITALGTASGAAAAGNPGSRAEMNKAITGISDNTATATFTVTVPNAAHSAMLKVTLIGSLGAGGAIGANEATGTISYDIAIARTAGVATVATLSSGYGSSTSSVAGAATITVTGAVSAMSGAVGATQTFTVNITIARGSGTSANHTALVYGRLMNANSSGITIS